MFWLELLACTKKRVYSYPHKAERKMQGFPSLSLISKIDDCFISPSWSDLLISNDFLSPIACAFPSRVIHTACPQYIENDNNEFISSFKLSGGQTIGDSLIVHLII